MKIAITGATGFIGSNLIQHLLETDVEIIAIARTTGSDDQSNDACTFLKYNIHEHDETCLDHIASADILIHLAWGGLPNYRARHHFEIELQGQYLFLKQLVKRGLINLVVSGTCLEYGMLSGALTEDMSTNSVTAYGYAKDCLRKQLQFLQNDDDFNLTWMRLFYTYGEGQAKNSLLPLLREAIEGGKTSFDMSAGEQIRDYLPVQQLVELIAQVAVKRQNIGVVNICSGRGITIRELVQKWIKENDWNIKLNFGKLPYADYEPLEFWGDREKLDNYLNDT